MLPGQHVNLHGILAPGDRSHIPDELRPIFQVVSSQLEQLKQLTPVGVQEGAIAIAGWS